MTEKSIKICNNKLEISEEGFGYMMHNPEHNLFIHAKKLAFGQTDHTKGWLMFYDKTGIYIGSVWLTGRTRDLKKVEKFLKETK